MASTEAPAATEAVMDSATLELVPTNEALKQWVAAQVKAEVARVASMGSKCVPVPAAAWGSDVEGEEGTVVHVLQAGTKFDFGRVTQVMLSDTTPVPEEAGSDLVLMFVVVLADKPVPLLMPYVTPARLAASLQQWCFVNSTGAGVRHSVETFGAVQG